MSDDHHDPEPTRWEPAAGSTPHEVGSDDDPTPPDPTPGVEDVGVGPPTAAIPPPDGGPPTMAVPPADGGPPTMAVPSSAAASGWSDSTDDTDRPAPERPDRRRTALIAAIVGILAAIAVVIGLVLAFGRGDDDPPPTTEATTTTTQRGDQRIEVHGVTIVIPADSLAPDAELSADLASMPTSHVRGFVPASTFLDVSIEGGAQTGPIRFEFPIDDVRTAPGDGDPILLALRTHGEETEIVDAAWDADRDRYVLELDDVAGIGIATWDWERVDKIVDGAVQKITAEPDADECDSLPDEVQIDGGAGVSWCVTGDDTRTVRGRNLTGNAIEVTWNGPDASDPADPSNLEQLVDSVPGWRSADHRILVPGSTIEFTVDAADEAAIATAFSDPAAAATWTAVQAEVLAGLSSILPSDHTTAVADVLGRLDDSCPADGAGIDDVMQNCFSPSAAAGLVGGAPAGYLDTLFVPDVLGRMLRTPLDAAEANLVDRSRGELRIGPVAVDGGSWPTDADDADEALREALHPDWSRCTDTRCLLGADGRVHLYQLGDDGWIWIATVDQDTNDPTGALLAAGVDEDLFADLLDP